MLEKLFQIKTSELILKNRMRLVFERLLNGHNDKIKQNIS